MSKQLRHPTLLVVTDNPSIRIWIKNHLDDQFFVLSADKRFEAIQALNASLDFIIVDALFEDCDALELCKDLSALSKKNLVPILLVTGRLKKSFRDQAMSAGVTDFLSDELDLEELQMHIDAGLKAAASRKKTEDFGRGIKLPKLTSSSTLKNKVVLNDQALKLLAAAKEEKTPVALLLMRIDQATGGEMLAPFIRGLLREKDVLISSADGGLILLLWNTKPLVAKVIAERLSEKIKNHSFESKKLTVSIAVSSLEASEKGFHKMIDSATKSLKTHSETNLIISIDPETL
jgi:PleD family two-component response regulator